MTWRAVVNLPMVIVVVPDSWGCGTPYKWPLKMAYTWGGDPNHLRPSWGAHPPSRAKGSLWDSGGTPVNGR